MLRRNKEITSVLTTCGPLTLHRFRFSRLLDDALAKDNRKLPCPFCVFFVLLGETEKNGTVAYKKKNNDKQTVKV